MNNINFGFISELEGGATCVGYVPDAENSKSGVTVATGFDIGQRSSEDLYKLLPSEVAAKLVPFCQLKGLAAQEALAKEPLKITTNETQIIDACSKRHFAKLIQHSYNQRSKVPFEQLPEKAQTVIASVAFQYGSLAKRCPTFWSLVIEQNWLAMVNELRNFGDRYTSRRHKEAHYFINDGMCGAHK